MKKVKPDYAGYIDGIPYEVEKGRVKLHLPMYWRGGEFLQFLDKNKKEIGIIKKEILNIKK